MSLHDVRTGPRVAFESWFSQKGGIVPDRAELMIWLDDEAMWPGGAYVETLSIDGMSWNLYHAEGWGSWNHYIAYPLVTPVDQVTDLDLKSFIDDSLTRGWLDENWYLDNYEAGFEIIKGGQGLASESFSGTLVTPEPGAIGAIALLGTLLLERRRERC